MRKFNLAERHMFGAGINEGYVPTTAKQQVFLEKPAALWVSYDGLEPILIGYGHEFTFTLDDLEDARIWSAVKGCAVVAPRPVYEPKGEVFTNFDKRPTRSPLEQSVTLALRKLKREEKQLRAERAALDRERLSQSELTSQRPPPTEEPEPFSDDEPAPDAEAPPTA